MRMTEPHRLSWSTLVFYALPAFALGLPTIPVYVFLPTFYAEQVGLGLTAVGAVLLVARVTDVITDPLMGILSDRSDSRFGRRKPWIAVGFLVAVGALVLLFQPPTGTGPTFLFFGATILYLGWTVMAVPYTAWGAELSGNYGERARITGAREALQLAGVIAAAGVPFAAAALGVGESGDLSAISWVAVATGIPAVVLLLWKVPDRPVVDAPEKRRFRRTDLRDIFSNRPFVRLLGAWFINGLANGIPAALFPLYLNHVLQVGATARGALILVYFLCGIAAIPLWVALSHRFGKHRVWCGAMVLACAAFVWVPVIPIGGVLWFSIVCVVTGMALGADLALPPAIQADVIDLDTLRHGRHRAGVFFALWSMGTKLALAAAVGFAFPTLDFLGFQVGGNNGTHVLMALAVIYSLVPIVLKVGAIAMVWNYPITHRRQRAVRRLIERHERRAAQTLKQE